jgi:hypothetical protein
MPKAVRMPKNLEEVPIHHPDPDEAGRHGHVGWFVSGFAAAALLFGAFLIYHGYFGSAVASHDDARTIIVGK